MQESTTATPSPAADTGGQATPLGAFAPGTKVALEALVLRNFYEETEILVRTVLENAKFKVVRVPSSAVPEPPRQTGSWVGTTVVLSATVEGRDLFGVDVTFYPPDGGGGYFDDRLRWYIEAVAV